ncbi:hypothetical protein BGZ83_009312 [Gryganskiella cystojenkinii]|nr:hypothetical protein BGZ83_009312 [Gryganskiella cystojenkinii]
MTQSTISTLQIVAATVHTNQSQTNRTCQVDSNNNKNNLTAGADAASYESFVTMSDSLVQIIQTNKNLRCLQLKPQGRFPPRLLDSLSRLDRLEILSLDGWEDFQEYSLRLILAGCQQLSHLSLGKNDFTRFSLDTLTCPETSSYLHNAKTVIKLEPFDDPIKGTHGRHYVDPDSLDIQSMRAVRCLAAPSTNLPLGSPLQQSYRHDQHYHPLSTLATARQGQTVVSQSGIRSLSLHQSGLRQEFLVNLTRQCPQLEHLSLIDGWGFYPSSKFALNLAQCCPQLSRLEFREQALDLQDEFFVSLCRHFPRLQWIHAGQTGFSQRALESVGIFCRDIVSLNLDGTRGIHSKTMESILRTCPSLKAVRAQGVVLNGRDLDKDYPWVCVGLETLVIDIEIYVALQTLGSKEKESETTVKNVRTKVYCQLAALSRIQWLGLGGGHRVGGKDSGVDLTLESGLGLLSTLQCLERLDLRRLVQNLGEEDLAWMVQHWPRLQKVEATRTVKNNYGGG